MKDINRAIELLNRFLQIREYYMLEKYKTVNRWQFIKLFGNFFTYYPKIDKLVTNLCSEPTEGENFQVIDDFLKKNNLVDNFIFVSSNPKGYDFGWSIFHSLFLHNLGKSFYNNDNNHLPYDENYIDKLKKEMKTGYYVCYNGHINHNRVLLLNELKRLGLENKGIISLLSVRDGREFANNNYLSGLETYPYKFESDFFKTYDFIPDKSVLEIPNSYPVGSGGKAATYFNKSHFEKNYFSVVSETYPTTPNLKDADTASFTEKTTKALGVSPFILNAERGVLRNLKKLGFETFPEWFDESYDDMYAGVEKTMFIAEQVNKVCSLSLSDVHKLYIKTLSKVVNNQHRLVDIYREEKDKVDSESHEPYPIGDDYITIECKTAGEFNENLFYFIDNELISKVEY